MSHVTRKCARPKGSQDSSHQFNIAAGTVAIVVKRRFLITCYTEAEKGRLPLDPSLIAGQTAGSHTGAKKILIYDTHLHPM